MFNWMRKPHVSTRTKYLNGTYYFRWCCDDLCNFRFLRRVLTAKSIKRMSICVFLIYVVQWVQVYVYEMLLTFSAFALAFLCLQVMIEASELSSLTLDYCSLHKYYGGDKIHPYQCEWDMNTWKSSKVCKNTFDNCKQLLFVLQLFMRCIYTRMNEAFRCSIVAVFTCNQMMCI